MCAYVCNINSKRYIQVSVLTHKCSLKWFIYTNIGTEYRPTGGQRYIECTYINPQTYTSMYAIIYCYLSVYTASVINNSPKRESGRHHQRSISPPPKTTLAGALFTVDKNKKKAQKKAPAQPTPATAADKDKNKKYKEFKFWVSTALHLTASFGPLTFFCEYPISNNEKFKFFEQLSSGWQALEILIENSSDIYWCSFKARCL